MFVSDEALTKDSGFYTVLKTLIEHEYIKECDAVMADKGFTIADKLREIGLKLNSMCTQTYVYTKVLFYLLIFNK